jgi:hypothetical protein
MENDLTRAEGVKILILLKTRLMKVAKTIYKYFRRSLQGCAHILNNVNSAFCGANPKNYVAALPDALFTSTRMWENSVGL